MLLSAVFFILFMMLNIRVSFCTLRKISSKEGKDSGDCTKIPCATLEYMFKILSPNDEEIIEISKGSYNVTETIVFETNCYVAMYSFEKAAILNFFDVSSITIKSKNQSFMVDLTFTQNVHYYRVVPLITMTNGVIQRSRIFNMTVVKTHLISSNSVEDCDFENNRQYNSYSAFLVNANKISNCKFHNNDIRIIMAKGRNVLVQNSEFKIIETMDHPLFFDLFYLENSNITFIESTIQYFVMYYGNSIISIKNSSMNMISTDVIENTIESHERLDHYVIECRSSRITVDEKSFVKNNIIKTGTNSEIANIDCKRNEDFLCSWNGKGVENIPCSFEEWMLISTIIVVLVVLIGVNTFFYFCCKQVHGMKKKIVDWRESNITKKIEERGYNKLVDGSTSISKYGVINIHPRRSSPIEKEKSTQTKQENDESDENISSDDEDFENEVRSPLFGFSSERESGSIEERQAFFE